MGPATSERDPGKTKLLCRWGQRTRCSWRSFRAEWGAHLPHEVTGGTEVTPPFRSSSHPCPLPCERPQRGNAPGHAHSPYPNSVCWSPHTVIRFLSCGLQSWGTPEAEQGIPSKDPPRPQHGPARDALLPTESWLLLVWPGRAEIAGGGCPDLSQCSMCVSCVLLRGRYRQVCPQHSRSGQNLGTLRCRVSEPPLQLHRAPAHLCPLSVPCQPCPCRSPSPAGLRAPQMLGAALDFGDGCQPQRANGGLSRAQALGKCPDIL